MPNQDGTGLVGKVSGSGRKLGKCSIRKSGGSRSGDPIESALGGDNAREDEKGINKGFGKPKSNNKGLQIRMGKFNEFSNPEWWK